MEENKVEQKRDNKKIILIAVGIIAVVTLLLVMKYFNNPVTKFKRNLDNVDVSKLQEIYSETQSYDEKKKIEKIFDDKLKSITKDFESGTKNYEDAIAEIDRYKDFSKFKEKVNSEKENIEKIKTSKDNFSEGKKYEEEENIVEAIKAYLKVDELDKNNYIVAQNYIKDNTEKIKNDTLAEVENLISNNDYATANKKLTELQEIIKDDSEIKDKINQIKDKAKEQEAEKYKNEQEITVESTRIAVQSDQYKSLYPDMIEVIIKNNSDKTIKDYNLAILAYDSNNYPLKIKTKYSYDGGKFELDANAENVNVIAGATSGQDYGWELDKSHGISKVLAIVKSATYYDGSTWENPYYTYWIEQYKEKPLQ